MEKLKFKKSNRTEITPHMFLITIALFVCCIIVLILYSQFPHIYNKPFTDKRLYFNETISKNEKQDILTIINNLKPEYSSTIKYLRIIKDKKEIDNNAGMNVDGRITIVYTNPSEFKLVLCHEILHNVVRTEWFTDNIAYYDVCYQNEKGL